MLIGIDTALVAVRTRRVYIPDVSVLVATFTTGESSCTSLARAKTVPVASTASMVANEPIHVSGTTSTAASSAGLGARLKPAARASSATDCGPVKHIVCDVRACTKHVRPEP